MRPRIAGPIAGRLPVSGLVAVFAALGPVVPAQEDPAPARVIALRVGTLHPVAGEPIRDAVVIVEGGRIRAIGAADEVEIPEGAEVLAHEDAHAYPGLVDVRSVAFAGDGLLDDASLDAAASVADALDPFHDRSAEVVAGGVTTAYVSNRSNSLWRGQGAVVRPRAEGFEPVDDAEGAVHVRMTAGPGSSHALQRREQLGRVAKELEALAGYEKTFTEHEKKLKEYEEKFAEYLAWHEKHGKDEQKEGDRKESGERPEQEAGERPQRGRGRGRRPRGEETPPKPPAGEEPKKEDEQEPAKDGEKPAAEGKPENGADQPEKVEKKEEEKAPKRPDYPKPPRRDPAKDALIEVRDGGRLLFVEAHRGDEIRMVLELARELPRARIVLEDATGVAPLADEVAKAGIPVVLTAVTPPLDSPYVPEDDQERSAVAALAESDAVLAIGSGSIGRARHLSLAAAEAVGQGLDADGALRAITLTPAELLGLADEIGSLEVGKRADVVVTTAPLLQSGARVVRVLSGGDTVFEEER